jgi:hypothetical protein
MESLEGQREFGDRPGIAKTLIWLGIVSYDEGDISTARTQLMEALAIQQEVGDRISMAATLDAFAGLSLEFANPADAARLWGHAQRVREEIGSRWESQTESDLSVRLLPRGAHCATMPRSISHGTGGAR